MVITTLVFYFLLSLTFLVTLRFFFNQDRKFKNLPPGPLALPLVGNLHQIGIGKPLHRAVHRLSQRYGPVTRLWFGNRLAVVVSSPDTINECFTKNDTILANRPRFLCGEYLEYKWTSMMSAPYGEHWRNLRRITTVDILSVHRLNTFEGIRTDEIKIMLQKVARNTMKGFAKVEMRPRLEEMTFNTITRIITGRKYWGEPHEIGDAEEAREFRDFIGQMVKLEGANNAADFMPILKWLDFDNLQKRLKSLSKRSDAFLQGLIDETRDLKKNQDTMLAHLLNLQQQQPHYYTDQIIKGLILVIIVGGTDTSASTLEWGLCLLLNHPEVLAKAKKEIDTVIGQDRLIEEADIPNLPYTKNVITETFRLYPGVPLLVPHESSRECTIGGYTIPGSTIILANFWALHRHPSVWPDPHSYNPERFEKGGDPEKVLPFGIGRRICPGANLGERTVSLGLALFIQCFDWKRLSEEKIDLTEAPAMTLPKLVPLQAYVRARPVVSKALV